MNLQKNYELRLAAKAIGAALEKIPQPHGGDKKDNDPNMEPLLPQS